MPVEVMDRQNRVVMPFGMVYLIPIDLDILEGIRELIRHTLGLPEQ